MAYHSSHTGAQIDEAVDKVLESPISVMSNRNILDNWFFANPVNQRGLTSYSTNDAYFIDRWKHYGTIPVTLQSDGIRLGDTTSNTVTYIRQFIDTPQLYAGKTLTYSVLVKDLSGTGNKGFIRWYANGTEQTSSIIKGELTTLTLTIPSSPTSLFFDIGSYWNNAFTAVSVKLELGSVSTLANDAPPNYAEELAKCQYYFCKIKANEALVGRRSVGNPKYSAFQIPVRMRATPSASLGTGSATIYGQSGATYTFSSFDNSLVDYNAIGVFLTGNATYAGEVLTMWSTSGISLSADL